MGLRKSLANKLVRGKVDVTIFYEAEAEEKKVSVNKALMESYHADLKEVAEKIGQTDVDYMGLMIRIPEVLRSEREELDAEEWNQIAGLVDEAASKLDDYRTSEGKVTEEDLSTRVNSILSLLNEADGPLNARMNRIKERISTNLEEFVDPDKIDANRFEQELIYFLEKLDVSEEQTRLSGNCNYFLEILESGHAQGKKLGFISQEIGREINTLGSKANDADVQRIVVRMKDDLEKIKEQILNVL